MFLRKYNIKVDVDGILCRRWVGVVCLMLGPMGGEGLFNIVRIFVFIKKDLNMPTNHKRGPESADQSNVFLATLHSAGVQLADINLGFRRPGKTRTSYLLCVARIIKFYSCIFISQRLRYRKIYTVK